ncbi:MAG: SDR family oxidoreductase [Candidatus Latescibacteria bacterium]|nr:SDR family oxidoreductase [Candidatus Latescibacterota bacterium]
MSYLETLFSLQGRIAVVTGASRGIGRGIATGLLGAGASAVLTGTDPKRLEAAVAEFKGQGRNADGFVCDVSDRGQIDGLVEYVRRTYGRIDILVNNAGVAFGHPALEYPDDQWDRTIRVNLEAPFRLIRGFGAMMKQQGRGVIINVTSINAEVGFPDNPAYAASKGGLKMMTKALANDLGRHGIRVNALGPGYVHTDLNAGSWADPERRRIRAERSMLGRWGEPEDLAGLAIFLASDASSFVTGQDFYADGGWIAKGL